MTDSKKRPRAKKPKAPRTAGGKKASPEVLAEATMTAREGYRERTEASEAVLALHSVMNAASDNAVTSFLRRDGDHAICARVLRFLMPKT